jgi:hypothetical protein
MMGDVVMLQNQASNQVSNQASNQASNKVSNQISHQCMLLRKAVWSAASLLCRASWYFNTGPQSSAGVQDTVMKRLYR